MKSLTEYINESSFNELLKSGYFRHFSIDKVLKETKGMLFYTWLCGRFLRAHKPIKLDRKIECIDWSTFPRWNADELPAGTLIHIQEGVMRSSCSYMYAITPDGKGYAFRTTGGMECWKKLLKSNKWDSVSIKDASPSKAFPTTSDDFWDEDYTTYNPDTDEFEN